MTTHFPAVKIRFANFRSTLVMLLGLLVSVVPLRAATVPDQHVILITIDGFPAQMFWDMNTSIPHIRKLASNGVAGKGLRGCNPTVTWPNHTTLVTGVKADKHTVLYNGTLTREGPGMPVKVDPKRTQSELFAVPTVFDFLHAKGFRTGAINWPCTRGATGLDDNFPDVPESLQHSTPRLVKEMIALGLLASDKDDAFRAMSGPRRDEVWTRAACHVIRERKPHFLLIHLLNTDGTHHRYGSQSPASHTALALADKYVGDILQAVKDAGLSDKTTFIITADHGFALASKAVQPNVVLKQAGLLEVASNNLMVRARAQVVPEGGTGMLYLTNPDTKADDLKKVLELFRNHEGIEEVLTPAEFAAHGYPSNEKTAGMADLVLVADEGYSIGAGVVGTNAIALATLTSNAGYHGYLSNNPKMEAMLVISGRGVKKGANIPVTDSIHIAPTVAHLLGQKFEGSDGKVLTEVLAQP